jgi:TonB-linked SusC/RagA family outer membrane protein
MKRSLLFFLVLCLSTYAAFSQNFKVTGRVTSSPSNEPIIGASVVIKGSTSGTITGADGSFSLNVPNQEAVLAVSCLGYKSTEVKVGSNTTLTITLEEDFVNLEDVVVIGYGAQRKEAVTGSVVTMKGEDLKSVPGANISTVLQGRVAGVQMSQTSSKPGAEMQVRIRGTRSLNATNDPLVVLDGIPFAGSIGDINPNDIKSIDILKDASATAIYGSRGANGVILVTTNKGTKGQQAIVSYNGYTGIKKIFAKYPMMNGSEFAALRKAAGQYKNTTDESDDVNTDWQDLLYQTGTVTNHDLGISGGTEKGSYNFGAGYYKDQAVTPLQDYTRYNIRTSVDQEVGKYFHFGLTSSSNYSVTNGNNLNLYNTLSSSPIADPYNEDGSWKSIIQQQTSGARWVYTKHSLEALDDQYIDQTRVFGSYNAMFGEVKIPKIDGLKYRINVGLNYRQTNYGNYTGEGVFSGTPTTVSTAVINNTHNINWAVENLITYDHTFAEKHKVNAVALYSAEQTVYNKSQVNAKDIPYDAFQFYNLGRANGEITVDPAKQEYKKYGLMSYMGRLMYSYDDRYMISATYRSDASSVLASGHKWHSYPAVSAGWNIKNESFMENLTQLNALKLRVGYGETSNQSIDPYQTLGLLSTRPYNFGSTYSTGYYVSKLPNPALGWEYSKTWNYGVDFAALENRLTGSLEYYVQNTSNVLLSVGLPATSGVSSYMANIGETQNKGFEFALNGVIIDNLNGWTWEAGINIYANHNELKSLASGQTEDKSNGWFVGHSINAIYDYKKIGLWQKDDKYREILEPGGNVGMIKVQYTGEYNADGTPKRAINTDDQQVIETDPKFQGGFNSRVTYKGFDFTVIGTFQKDGIINSTLYGGSGYLNNMNGRSGNNVKVDYWTETNTGAKYPKPGGVMQGDNPKYSSTLGYFDATYLKIRTISLGYTFNQSWLRNNGVNNLRVYCTVENPFIFFSPYKDESGMDPETNSYGDENVAVSGTHRMLIVGTNTPTTRNYLLGLNITF